MSPSYRNLITHPADVAPYSLHPCLVPLWSLVNPLSLLECVLALRAVVLLYLLSLYSQFLHHYGLPMLAWPGLSQCPTGTHGTVKPPW